MFTIGLTDHLEGPLDGPSEAIFTEVTDLVRRADRLGVRYAWFSEHHAHAHQGHLPTPLLMALHLAGQTQEIRLGTAIICLNLHHPLDVAEQVAVADILTGGRMAVGFGSGSTPEESALFGSAVADDRERQARFAEALRVIQSAWSGDWSGTTPHAFSVPPHRTLPVPSASLAGRCWVAVNSLGSARIAGDLGFNMLFSHLRTPEQYRDYCSAYRAAGGAGLVAANRPVFVGPDDATAFARVEPALRTLWRRFRQEGKIPAETREPANPEALCAHPINFIVGGPETVARQLLRLHEQSPFDVANVEVRWAGLSHERVCDSVQRLMEDVMPRIKNARPCPAHNTRTRL
ncbi:Flavin-dependent oxidoreductase, luciferase family (includes alkanesulfonate monooxygenase SsuD and methylene tetrahydromethanopterin reductase) [Singulisphaera sp. GP187]|uniref:LLM class flavin-dependent oxidoreductase n=1 Tax=Singulisphaera sp. GP187 TaxID=1882752 RepID=UPI000929202D|nr:LLM class flavin-dependent oxidoreductase [Singulisphaera sp. GP187]SIO13814.1 Flavin-dependent oxidoreductase, luciferase family (includes alkanesulfonate monooxygenase SsuD and methylene tetrahydromethanopterin reductase) [Singulisphaera sp. GP187]